MIRAVDGALDRSQRLDHFGVRITAGLCVLVILPCLLFAVVYKLKEVLQLGLEKNQPVWRAVARCGMTTHMA